MNLREGTRRLALLLGAVGAILGGFASYDYLQTSLSQRAHHNKFEQLATSDVVKQERKTLQAPPDFIPAPNPWDKPTATPATQGNPWDKPTDGDAAPWQKYGASPPGHDPAQSDEQPEDIKAYTPEELQAPSESTEVDWHHFIHIPSVVNSGGIRTINWAENYGVASIETEDGQTFYPTPAPAAWEYLLIVLFPVAGFVIPWGVIRAMGWVGAGFVATDKAR